MVGPQSFPAPWVRCFASDEKQYAASTAYDFELEAARIPDSWRAVIVCKTTDAGYLPGDEVGMEFLLRPSTNDNCAVSVRDGVVRVITGASFALAHRSSGVFTVGTAARWTIKVYAIWVNVL